MAEDNDQGEDGAKPSSKKPLFIGLGLLPVAAAGGYFAVSMGLLPFGGNDDADMHKSQGESSGFPTDIAFLPLEPLVVSIGSQGRGRHLRFQAQLEVPIGEQEAVLAVLPRIIDVLNGYLRAVDVAMLEDPAVLSRLRAQMLRRIQIVAGEGRVRDVLIMEFVLS